jgi:GNAT superfamily N-acetyltransferase
MEHRVNQLSIRKAVAKDAALILHFIRELAIYEKAEHEVLATEQSIRQSIFSEDSHVSALICEQDGKALGMAIYFYNYSTWLAKPGLYLEDLYVSPESRGKGAGKLLLKKMAQIALQNNCGRFEWSCLDWNKPSRDFYHSVGAQSQDEWIGYRLSGQTLLDFAKDN